ncbi:hypothetical protein N7504_005184 [Penicillium tannophilum]|nr:hypothetical protein N7504_005184 [Penicillium tannophilum]
MTPPTDHIPLIGIKPFRSSHEQIIKAQIHVQPSKANYFSIYRHANASQLCFLFVSATCAAASGAAMPLVTVAFGSLAKYFINERDASSDDIRDHIQHLTLRVVYIAIGAFFATMISAWGFNVVGEQIARRLQRQYLSSVLRQNIAFFDVLGAGELTTHIDQDMKLIQAGISQKVGEIISGLSGFVIAVIIAFMQNRHFASIMISQPIALLAVVGIMGFWLSVTQKLGLAQCVKAENLAQEVLSAMRNVIAYGSQQRYSNKYHEALKGPTAVDFRERFIFGVIVAGSFLVLHWTNGLGLWQANHLFQQGKCTIPEALTILYAAAVAGGMLSQVLPCIVDIIQANSAAGRVFPIIDRPSPIDALEDKGDRLDSLRGDIKFENVNFVYPSRPENAILEEVSFHVPAGQTVAFVGPSGSGKSTVLSLLERLYCPLGGHIMVDDHPIEDLNISWLRSRIGCVSQDITLFDGSIHDNIANGLDKAVAEVVFHAHSLDLATLDRLVVQASEIAQIHSFISNLPQGYATRIGANGSHLSGGQRQRIAIARAIISQPSILLLDEATAALDSQSEKEVQEALRSAALGRTTLIIAHRLSTIRNADTIIIMKDGRILEQGSHTELMKSSILYQGLVRQQALRPSEPSTYSLFHELPSAAKVAWEGIPKPSVDVTTSKTSNDVSALASSGMNSIRNIWRLNKQELPYNIAGLCLSILAGISFPVHAIFFGNGIISIISPELSTGGRSVQFWARMYLIYGIIVFCVYCARGYCFAIAASQLNLRVRSNLFRALLCKNISFFEEPGHSVGDLVSFLSWGTSKVTGVSGTSLGLLLESAVMLLTGIVVGCIFGWKLGLISMATVPIVAISGFLQYYIVDKVQKHVNRDTEAISVAHEAFSAIRTVTVLGLQQKICESFQKAGDCEQQGQYWPISAVMYGSTLLFRILSIAFVFWYGGTRLVVTGEYNIQQFLICFAATIWGAQSAAALFARAPDLAGARSAASRLDELMGPIQSQFQAEDIQDVSLDAPTTTEPLSLRSVTFNYSDRNSQLALDDVSLNASPGAFIALVGATGSGKSSVINLVERFYSPRSGNITLAGRPINDYNIDSYRKYLALVDQNPCLVGEDLRECLQSDEDDISDNEILLTLENIGMSDFVMSLSEGLNTPVLGNGSTLSGGQRQRMAIAKALLRKPKILLLDEATSALDTATEQLVQETLQRAMTGRITIAIAHRLKTVVDANQILVFDHGRIIESGTHDDLMQLGGKYFQMAKLQQLDEGN